VPPGGRPLNTSSKQPDEVRKHLPLRPPVLHLLLGLAAGPAHGYALKLEVERRTQGTVRLGPGTLYESIQRMEKRGLIQEVETPREDDDRRRTWQITDLGRRTLVAELERLDAVVRHARSLRLLPEMVS